MAPVHRSRRVDRPVNQLHWAQFYVRSRTPTRRHKNEDQVRPGDTQLGAVERRPTRQGSRRRSGRTRRSSAVVGPAGSQEVVGHDAGSQGRGPRLRLRLGDAHAYRLTPTATRRGYFFRTVPNDDVQARRWRLHHRASSSSKRVYIIDDQETYSMASPTAVQTQLKAKGVTVSRDGVSQQHSDFSSADQQDPAQHAARLHPMAAAPQGPGLRPADQGRGQGQHQAVRLRRSLRRLAPGRSRARTTRSSRSTRATRSPGVQEGPPGHGALRSPELRGDAGRRRRDHRACKDGKASRAEVRHRSRRRRSRRPRCSGCPSRSTERQPQEQRFGIYQSRERHLQPGRLSETLLTSDATCGPPRWAARCFCESTHGVNSARGQRLGNLGGLGLVLVAWMFYAVFFSPSGLESLLPAQSTGSSSAASTR